jgi:hypothetical protein
MELSRRHDGSIAIAGLDDRYNRSVTACSQGRDWGTFFALTYTLPRKKLQLFGAPRSPYAAKEAIPVPWGNKADEIYHSIEPIPGGPLTMQDLLNETVENGSSKPFFTYVNDPDASDQTLIKYIHHPESGYREATVRAMVNQGRFHLILPMLKHRDTRIRQCGLMAIVGTFKGRPMPQDKITPAMMAEVSKMIMNPDESWWTATWAIQALGRADKATIAKHRDRLLEFMTYYNSPWLEGAASLTLAKIAVEPAHYKILLPALLEKATKFRVDENSQRTSSAIRNALKSASPEVKEFAKPYIVAAYKSIPDPVAEPNTGAVFGGGTKVIRSRIGPIMKSVGGEDLSK